MRLARFSVKLWIIGLVLSAVLVTASSCLPDTQKTSGIRLGGAWDLYYLSVAINEHSRMDNNIPSVQMFPSADSLAGLRQGKYDAVLLGREPDPAEMSGVRSYLIAYDAVCIIIDENSYAGGEYWFSKRPVRKTTGLRELTTGDLRDIFSTNPGGGWQWQGEVYQWEPLFDPGKQAYAKDAKGWKKVPQVIGLYFVFPVGKFDTQSVLYRKLGLDELALISRWKTLPINARLNLEEEVLSQEYSSSLYYSTKYGPQDFSFKLGFASRRVMTVAPRHVPVRVVSIDGINPLEEPERIYDGTYRLGRKIYLLVPEKISAPVMHLVNFLQSEAGQRLIAEAGYLPVPQTQ